MLVLSRKTSLPQPDDLELAGLGIESLSAWADGRADTDWMLPMFWGIARAFPNVRVGEIGMNRAISTLAFCLAARDTGGHVWSIDIADCIEGRRSIQRAGLADVHTFIHGDSACMEFPEPLDVLFIDGEHTYQALALDYGQHRGMVKPGGVVLFHDTVSYPEVGQFCREIGATDLAMGAGLGVLGC